MKDSQTSSEVSDGINNLDQQQKRELERLKKFQSIKSEIFADRILELQGRLRFFYMTEVELDRVKIEQKIVVREKDESLINRLKPQIESEGLIEPLTLLDMGSNQFLLLAGQHRYYVCKHLGVVKVPAKIYLNLDLLWSYSFWLCRLSACWPARYAGCFLVE